MVISNLSARFLCTQLSNWSEYEEIDRAHPSEDISKYVQIITERIEDHIKTHTLKIQAGSNLPISRKDLVSRFEVEKGFRKIKNITELLVAYERYIQKHMPSLSNHYSPTQHLTD